jgi:DNA-binding beta-propeller fold protein YncE
MLAEVSYSRDGRYLVAVDVSGHIIRLDPRRLTPTGDALKLPEKPYAVAASPDGHYGFVVAGGTRWMPYWDVPINHFYLVDLRTNRVVRSGYAGVSNAVYCDFSPDGRHVTVGGRNGQVAVIDTATGKPVRRAVNAYSGDTYSVRYNATGSLVTVASQTSQLAVLDGRTGALLATASLPASEHALMSNFAPDGTVLAASFAGHVFRWDPSTQHALDFACRVTGRGLSPSEWREILPDEAWRPTCAT